MANQEYISAAERGARITALRIRRGYSLRQLAGQLGVSASALSRYEAGLIEHIPIPTLEKLALLLDADVRYLQYGGEEKSGAGEEDRVVGQSLFRVYKPFELARLVREGKLGPGRFLLQAGSEAVLPPRILPGDILTIEPCAQFLPDAVNLLLGPDGKVLIRDVRVQEIQGGGSVYILSVRDGAAMEMLRPDADSAYTPIGVCVRLESELLRKH